MTKEDLKTMQAWSLERKIQVTQTRIIEWYQHWEGKVYISFSGGKDSTVLLDLARRIYPDIEAVFVDTGLEYPEIRDFVKTKENVTWLKPKMRFDEVIKTYGYPVISKEISKIIYGIRHGVSERSKHTYCNKMKGLNPDGTVSKFKQRYIKHDNMIGAPYEISNRCCPQMKEKPFLQYESRTKNKPIIGTMAEDSQQRKDGWIKTGCNAFDSSRPMSKPLSFWTEQDILQYLLLTKLPYCSIYGDIVIGDSGKLKTTGAQRTGCMFCMFGVQSEPHPNRFQKMFYTHPKQWDYCINKLGCGAVMDYIGVRYTPEEDGMDGQIKLGGIE